jgi:glycosyltransferase involved in cell wall biosynthesis
MTTNITKKRILFCTESAHIKSGYGNYTRSILDRLFATNKYEIAELSCYRTCEDAKDCPWTIYPNAVTKTDPRFVQYNASTSNKFGQWRFDLAIAHFKPDIVIDFRDIFMTSFERTSIFRNKFHWILAPTIDSFPVRHEWLDLIKNCDTLLTHTEWAKQEISKLYNVEAKGVVKDSIDTSVFRPLNKMVCRQNIGLPMDAFVLGSVMRNQKRKLIPDLLQVLETIKTKHNTYLYLHTSFPETIGWELPDLLLEFGVYDKVYFTYVCKHCKHWLAMKWQGPQAVCSQCSKKSMTLTSVSNGLNDTELVRIYNSLDLYIQYAVCEGFGIPPLEAAACGVPFLTVDHGAMGELADGLGMNKVPVSRYFRDQEQNADRVYPDNDKCIEMIDSFYKLSMMDKVRLSEKLRSKVLEQNSWDYTSQAFMHILDQIEPMDSDRWQPISASHFENIPKAIKEIKNNRDFIYTVLDTILEAPELKHSFFIQQLIMSLDNGFIATERDIVPYTQKDAMKTLEVWFNNKVMLNRFLGDPTIIKQDDFLKY